MPGIRSRNAAGSPQQSQPDDGEAEKTTRLLKKAIFWSTPKKEVVGDKGAGGQATSDPGTKRPLVSPLKFPVHLLSSPRKPGSPLNPQTSSSPLRARRKTVVLTPGAGSLGHQEISAQVRQRPRSATPTSGLGWASYLKLRGRTASPSNTDAPGPSASDKPDVEKTVSVVQVQSPTTESDGVPPAKPRPRITSLLSSGPPSRTPSPPVDEQELVDLSLDVVATSNDETDDDDCAANVLSPPHIVARLPPGPGDHKPQLLRLPAGVRSILSPRPLSSADNGSRNSSPLYYTPDGQMSLSPEEANSPRSAAMKTPTMDLRTAKETCAPSAQMMEGRQACATQQASRHQDDYCRQCPPGRRDPSPSAVLDVTTELREGLSALQPVKQEAASDKSMQRRIGVVGLISLGLIQMTVSALLSAADWKSAGGGGTWWAGALCAVAGLMQLQTPGLRLVTRSRPEAAPVSGVVAGLALVVAAMLEMGRLQGLRQAKTCGGPSLPVSVDYHYQENVRHQTLGEACGFTHGCCCIALGDPMTGTNSFACTIPVEFRLPFVGCSHLQRVLLTLSAWSLALQLGLIGLVVFVLSGRRRRRPLSKITAMLTSGSSHDVNGAVSNSASSEVIPMPQLLAAVASKYLPSRRHQPQLSVVAEHEEIEEEEIISFPAAS